MRKALTLSPLVIHNFIYIKPTNTDRCIQNKSYHEKKSKFAAFYLFYCRAVNIPFSEKNFKQEVDKINHIAAIDGFNGKVVESMLRKHRNKKYLWDITSLSLLSDEADEIVYTSARISKIFNRNNIQLSPKSTGYKTKTLFGNAKDNLKFDNLKTFGIHCALCCNCDNSYIYYPLYIKFVSNIIWIFYSFFFCFSFSGFHSQFAYVHFRSALQFVQSWNCIVSITLIASRLKALKCLHRTWEWIDLIFN